MGFHINAQTDNEVIQRCIERASYQVSVTNNAETRMVLDALIENQTRQEKDSGCRKLLELALKGLINSQVHTEHHVFINNNKLIGEIEEFLNH